MAENFILITFIFGGHFSAQHNNFFDMRKVSTYGRKNLFEVYATWRMTIFGIKHAGAEQAMERKNSKNVAGIYA